MEILTGPFGSTTQILDLINNVAIREPLRRYAPQRCAVFVSKVGTIVLLVRSKGRVPADELSSIRDRECPGTFYFMASSGLYTSPAAFQERIEACVQPYSIPPPSGHMEDRVIDGKKVLIIGSGKGAGKKRDSQ